MKPSVENLIRLCPGVDEEFVLSHLTRLEDEYFERFSVEDVCEHIRALAALSPEEPAKVLFRDRPDGTEECVILGFDHPYEFSLITGALAGMGFSVVAGDTFTYQRSGNRVAARRNFRGRSRPPTQSQRRKIVDQFIGKAPREQPFGEWAEELRRRMLEIMRLVESEESDSGEKAKRMVNEWVTERLASTRVSDYPALYPIELALDNSDKRFTRLKVVSQDTPAFLYSLSAALSLNSVSIEKVRIRTIHGRIEDEIDFVDFSGRPILDPRKLDQVKFSALLTKQFTYFLDKAPDPYTALARFEKMAGEILRLPQRGRWEELLSEPATLKDLARILGASDFMWEDFIRLQYESLLPIIAPAAGGRPTVEPPETLSPRLAAAMDSAPTFEEKKHRLNEFKNREIFLIDLDHILHAASDFSKLSERLTRLAETVVRAAAETVYERLARQHGEPRSVAGFKAAFAIFGLGKTGGEALGYASDIELMFVFDDNGQTDGKEAIGNDEFFSRLAMETAQFIEAKREGIFHVDLRLRPHGNSGPLACSVESFCRYYGPGGAAHSYERLSLVRLRAIGGDKALGERIERLRDEFVYATGGIKLDELKETRLKQFEEKKRPGEYNAKFSPGALVDLEYAVQALQALYGQKHPQLRTPRVHSALDGLRNAGILDPAEAERLVASYDFLRRLINGLRMLRGSAKDLFLPRLDSDEFTHLARRMGYEQQGDLKPAQQLHIDFETKTAAVRVFVERHFGRDSIPGSPMGNVADLLISDFTPADLRKKILAGAGFRETDRAHLNLRRLAGEGSRRDIFVKLAVLACDALGREPDPDMALNNWERFVSAMPAASAEKQFELFLSQPKRVEILLGIFSRSQFLADTLIREPEFLEWVTDPKNLRAAPSGESLEKELAELSANAPARKDWLAIIRRLRRREILRVGARDMCLGIATNDVMRELSVLADAIVQAAVARVLASFPDGAKLARNFCVFAFGKLGGRELNYSSDIDLLGVYDSESAAGNEELKERYAKIMERTREDISAHTPEGYVYRVDLRLRPYGSSGDMVFPSDAMEKYYAQSASLWEIQALLKLRPIAGSLELGSRLSRGLEKALLRRWERKEVSASVRKLRALAIGEKTHGAGHGIDVKTGAGGLRDIEFLAQGLQMTAAKDRPELLTGNTLEALDKLGKAGILPAAVVAELAADYIFLRRVEHYLQILEDRQTHVLPSDEVDLTALAKRMLGLKAGAAEFMDEIGKRLTRVHEAYETYLK